MKRKNRKIQQPQDVAEMEKQLDALLSQTDDVDEIEDKLGSILAKKVVTPVDASVIDVMSEQLDKTLTVSDIEKQVNEILADGRISPLEAELLPILSKQLDDALKADTVARPSAPAIPLERSSDDPVPPVAAGDPVLVDEQTRGCGAPASATADRQPPADKQPSTDRRQTADKQSLADMPQAADAPESEPDIPPPSRDMVSMGNGLYFSVKDGRTYRVKKPRRGFLGGKLR